MRGARHLPRDRQPLSPYDRDDEYQDDDFYDDENNAVVNEDKPDKPNEPPTCRSPRVSKGAELNELSESVPPAVAGGSNPEPDPVRVPRVSKGTDSANSPVYKSIHDKDIQVGDIVRNDNGQLMKRTHWGGNSPPT